MQASRTLEEPGSRGAERLARIFATWQAPRGQRKWLAIGFTTILLAAAALVYRMGGTSLVYVHLVYLPILAGAFFFGVSGSLIVGLAAGLAMGPLMPLDTQSGLPQETFNWVARTVFFALSASLAGFICAILGRQLEIVRRHAYHDRLTGLPNRSRLLEDLRETLRSAGAARDGTILLTLGLPHVGTVVTTLGHRHADALLQAVGERLRGVVPGERALYDLGGGSYAILIVGGSYEQAMAYGRKALGVMRDPFEIDGVPALAGGHLGVARHPHHAADGLSLLRAAAAALHDAMRAGQPHAIYDDKHDRLRRATLGLPPDLQAALHAPGQLMLVYQPKIRLDTGECVGVEALVRWRHPERGMVPPGQFVPLAEQTALIGPLTEWVIGAALRQLAEWKAAGLDQPIAVNVSIRNLEDSGFPAVIGDLLKFHGIEASRLEIEVTESALMSAPDSVTRTLSALRSQGVAVALDDFGTGQSSLSYLRNLPADTLKLDRSFIQGLAADRKNQIIVGAAIDTAHLLGFKVTAEGIEDEAVRDRLRALSCDLGQGYFIAPPLPDQEFRTWLRARASSPRADERAALLG